MQGKFCPSCGSSQDAGGLATVTSDPSSRAAVAKATSRSSRTSSASSSSVSSGRFLPGTLLATRYRIIAILGRGGMGEVYRADDLTLNQPVALKFLPEATTHDEAALERFRNEVRIARRVSHPNVCRIYDIGEAEGLAFLSMEYIDGEDLGSLLRRIGRLPADKALEIARKLCAGLAAAHAKGVLHRDLKPANIMLDSEGEVAITDFGLAALAANITQDEVRHGTPAYMAPEQLAGKEVTAKSDIYSLGLVLYEIFTGKRAFHADTLGEIVRTRTANPTPAKPSSLVRDLDPAVERVVLRCLEPDPAMRPASVLAVAAALPGGDPLAAALEAGETPSPQMVAAAGESEGLSPRVAVPCLAFVLIALVASYFIGAQYSAFPKLDLSQSPEVLTHRAAEIASQFGNDARVADSVWGFFDNLDYDNYVQEHSGPRTDWSKLLSERPSIVRYAYRTSPVPLVATEFGDSRTLNPGVVDLEDPPPTRAGMMQMQLDLQGRLVDFERIPEQLQSAPREPKPVDWAPMFSSAGLEMKDFHPAVPLWNSLASADTRLAWTGEWPGSHLPLRVEAAALGGEPVFFRLVGPWDKPNRQAADDRNAGQKAGTMILITVGLTVLIVAILLAIRNLRKSSADLRGASRIAGFLFLLDMVIWILRAHLTLSIGSVGLFMLAMCGALFLAAAVGALYIALEPYIRRHWPQTIISWSRLLLGRWRDPLVGRDVLFGFALGMVWVLAFNLRALALVHLGNSPYTGDLAYLIGARRVAGEWLLQLIGEVQGTFIFFFLLFLLRVLLRNKWLAGLGFVAIWVTLKTLGSDHYLIDGAAWTCIYAIAAFAVVRFGLVSLVAALFATDLLLNLPITTNTSSWFIGAALFGYASVAALTIWGFHTALAGKKLWKEELFD